MLHELPGAAGQARHDSVLELAEFGEIDPRLAELHAPRLRMPRFVDHLGDMQQRL
jgi:hypothetical protein